MITPNAGLLRYGLLAAAVVAFLATGCSAKAADSTIDTQNAVSEDFDVPNGQLPNGWQAWIGSCRVIDGALVVDGLSGGGLVTFGDPTWQNYEIQATATFLEVADDDAWLALVVRAEPEKTPSGPQFILRRKTTRDDGAQFAVPVQGNWAVRQQAAAKVDCAIGRPIQVRAVVHSTTVQGFVNGQRLIECPFCLERQNGLAGLAVKGCRVKFDNVALQRLPDTPAPTPLHPKPCKVVAHRGFSFAAPENTLIAAKKAVDVGAAGSEFDVYRCADGELVVMHDEDVNRTTTGSGKVTELTLAQLKKLDAGSWKGQAFAGQRVPSLAEILSVLKDSGCAAVIEIKMDGISAKVVQAVRHAKMLDQTCVISFKPDAVKEVRQLEPTLPCAWLCGESLNGTPAERADQLARQAKECRTSVVDLYYQLLSPELIRELKHRGVQVWCWTVDDPLIMTALSAWGVESITTNRPDVALQTLPRTAADK